MAFAVEDVQDLLRVLRENPEWREAVRREILGEELLSLPDLVRRNSEDIAALRASIDELRATMEANSERLDARVEALSAEISRVSATMEANSERLDARVEALSAEISRVSATMEANSERLDTRVEALSAEISRVSATMEANSERLDARVEALSAEISRVSATMEANSERLDARVEALSAEISRVSATMEANSERLDARIEALTNEVSRLDAALAALTVEVSRLDAALAALTAEVSRLDAALAVLTTEVGRVNTTLEALSRELTRGMGRVGNLEGWMAELRWQQRFSGRFGRLVRRTRLLTPRDLTAFEDADEAGTISQEEADAVRRIDLLVEGVAGRGDDAKTVLLAVEISTFIEPHDIERAIARSATLRRVGYDAMPVVAGARMDASLRDNAVARGVQVVLVPEDLPEIEP